VYFFFQAEDGIRDRNVTGVQTCALPILLENAAADPGSPARRDWRFYGADGEGLYVDADALLGERGTTAGYIEGLLTATAARPAKIGRASCRERVKDEGVRGALKQNREDK